MRRLMSYNSQKLHENLPDQWPIMLKWPEYTGFRPLRV